LFRHNIIGDQVITTDFKLTDIYTHSQRVKSTKKWDLQPPNIRFTLQEGPMTILSATAIANPNIAFAM